MKVKTNADILNLESPLPEDNEVAEAPAQTPVVMDLSLLERALHNNTLVMNRVANAMGRADPPRPVAYEVVVTEHTGDGRIKKFKVIPQYED